MTTTGAPSAHDEAATTHAATTGRDGSDDHAGAVTGGGRSRRWPVPLLAFAAWFAGLLPWLVLRGTTGTFGTPWNPRNDLRSALLPFHHQQLTLLVSVVLACGVLAGLAPLWVRERTRRRWPLALLASLGAVAATTWAVLQTLAPDPSLGGVGSTAKTVMLAFAALTAGFSVVGLLVGLAVSLGGPALRAVAGALAAVALGQWVSVLAVACVPSLGTAAWLTPVIAVHTGVGAGVLLAAVGFGSVGRVLAWLVAAVLLVTAGAALTSLRYVLESLRGTRPESSEVAELVSDGVTVLRESAAISLTAWPPSPPVVTALVALAVGVAGALALRRVHQPGS